MWAGPSSQLLYHGVQALYIMIANCVLGNVDILIYFATLVYGALHTFVVTDI